MLNVQLKKMLLLYKIKIIEKLGIINNYVITLFGRSVFIYVIIIYAIIIIKFYIVIN